LTQYPTTKGLSIVDRDPLRSVEDVESTPQHERTDLPLRVGSVQGK